MAMKPKSTRFLGTETERRERRLEVIGYVDLRPVNWFTGKREPLAKGEGNICDRCGAEHAHVYTLRDVDSRETFKVGSGCAKRSFGFDPSQDPEAKRMVKAAEREAADRAAKEKQARIDAYVTEIAGIVGRIPIPEARLLERTSDIRTSSGEERFTEWWALGDAKKKRWNARANTPLPDDDLQDLMVSWAQKRAMEHMPAELRKMDPNNHLTTHIASKVAWRLLRGRA